MSNDSSTGGPLSPIGPVQIVGAGPVQLVGAGPVTPYGAGAPPPNEDDPLDDFFQTLVVNLTGLQGQFVRPRFQAEPPALPAAGVNWAAVGVMPESSSDFAASVVHESDGQGRDRVTRHEVFRVLCSFYGPAAKANGSLLRDALAIAQNREPLFLAQMALADLSDLTRTPELQKGRMLNRWDITLSIRRATERTFPVRNLAGADVTLTGQTSAGTLTRTFTAADD
jgi:hypothetical protein